MAEDLKQERNRLGNRVRDLLWRFYPQMLGLTDDVAAPWFLDLWRLIPTPEKGDAGARSDGGSPAQAPSDPAALGGRRPRSTAHARDPPCARHGERGDGPSRGRRQAARSGQPTDAGVR